MTIKVSELPNNELCEAISELREPRPTDILLFCGVSENYNWTNRGYNMQSENYSNWQAINWLAPENWTRLLEELTTLEFFYLCYEMIDGTWAIMNYEKEYLSICQTPARAVCEAWLIAFGGGKYE